MTSTRPLHWEAFPTGAIEGLTDAEISAHLDDFDLEKAGEELDSTAIDQLLVLEQSVDDLDKECAVASTEDQERRAVKRLNEFIDKNEGLEVGIATCDRNELAHVIRLFYGTLRRANGGCYSPASLVCIRAGLFRYFARTRAINIITEKEFFNANATLKALARKFVSDGGRSKPFEAIEKDDLERLRVYFDRSSPMRLQQEVYFAILFYFGNRGREAFRNLSVQSFVFDKRHDSDVIRMALGKVKCLGNELSADSARDSKDSVMIATDAPNCPVSAMRLYIQKLNESIPSGSSTDTSTKSEAFFLRPNLKNWQAGVWYHHKQPVGLNSIGNYMRDISKSAGLSRTYTGHCVRATVIAELFNAGHAPTDIAAVTGHKDSRSVERYLKNSKRARYKTVEMAKSLVESMGQRPNSPDGSTDEGHCVVSSQDTSSEGGSRKAEPDKKGGRFYFSNCNVHFH